MSLQRYCNAVMDQLKELFGLPPNLVNEVGIYQALLQGITQNNMRGHHCTLDVVMALKAVVHVRVREKGVKTQQVPLDKLSVDQFLHCLAYLAGRCELKDVTPKVRANMWQPKTFERQYGQMRGDEVWPGLAYVPGVDMENVMERWAESRDDNKVIEQPQGVNGRESGTKI